MIFLFFFFLIAETDTSIVKAISAQIVCPCDCKKIVLPCDCSTAEEIKNSIKAMLQKGMEPKEILNYYKVLYGEKVASNFKKEGIKTETIFLLIFISVIATIFILYLFREKIGFLKRKR